MSVNRLPFRHPPPRLHPCSLGRCPLFPEISLPYVIILLLAFIATLLVAVLLFPKSPLPYVIIFLLAITTYPLGRCPPRP